MANKTETISKCYGCNEPLKNLHMLVCAECLNEESVDFLKFAEKEIIESNIIEEKENDKK